MINAFKSGVKHPEVTKFISEYIPTKHQIVTDLVRHPNRENVSEYYDEHGEKHQATQVVPLNRIPLAYQQEITSVAVAFLLANPITFVNHLDDDEFYTEVMKVYTKMKFRDKEQQIAHACSTLTQCAVFFYIENQQIQSILLLPDAYRLYPVFDEKGNMTSFGREFKKDGKTLFEVWTDKETFLFEDEELKERRPNLYGKIPFVYFEYPETEWNSVQPAIERIEAIYSNVAESNDRFAFPILKLRGQVQGQLTKDRSGKVLALDEGADVDFVTPPNAIESLEKEIQRLERSVRHFTATPDFSFDNLVAIANVLASGNSKSLFIQPHLKVMQRAPLYVTGFRRILSLIATLLAYLEPKFRGKPLDITPVITPFTIDSEKSLADFLLNINGNQPLISQAEAMKRIGVTDPDKMINQILEENTKRNETQNATEF